MRFRSWLSQFGAGMSPRGLLALIIAVLAVGACMQFTSGTANVARAQADMEDPDAKAAAAAPKAADPAATGGDTAPATKPAQSQLAFFYEALGLKYVVIFLVISFAFVALLVMNFLTLRRNNIVPIALVEGFEANLNEKRYQEAYDLAKADESFLGHVLAAGLAKLSTGYDKAVEAMQEVGEDENMKLEHRLSYIALIGTVAPMFGLLGTVDGMVASFQVIANSTAQPKPSELASGISQALITTLVGLWIAIPAIMAFGIFRNRMGRLMLEVGILSEGLMGRFQQMTTPKK
jgi:biopolymer transport protein ExbB